MINGILEELNDTESTLGKLIAKKEYQMASSTIYAMLSMVNLPDDVVSMYWL